MQISKNSDISNLALSSKNDGASLFENGIWLTTQEAAAYLRRSVGALRNLIYRGKIRARKFEGRLYFSRKELFDLLDTSYYFKGGGK